MIRLWAEVYDATYTTQIADSDLLLVAVSVDQVLDGPGNVSIETPVLHVDYTSRALDVLQVKRVVEVWYQESEDEDKRRVTSFVIEKTAYAVQSNGVKLTVRGVDTLSLLENYTTGLGLEFDNLHVTTVVNSLLDIAGWEQDFDLTSYRITTRFDGTSILKALQAVAEATGYHFRLSDTFKTLEFGEFGDDSGYRIVKVEGDKPSPDRESGIIPLETIDIETDSREIVNWVIPLSSGQGDSRGDLSKSTRTSPYTIMTTTINSRTHYYLTDSDSVSSYGEVRKILNFSKIAPIGVSDTSQERTANYLYDAAAEWLARHKDPLEFITVRVYQARVALQVGDQVRVEHIDRINVGGTPVTLKAIDALYWVMGVRESYGDGGEKATLELASVDRNPNNLGAEIVSGLDAIDVQETGYSPTYNIWSMGPYSDYVSTTEDVTFKLTIPDDCLQVDNVTLIVHTFSDRQSYVPSTPLYVTLSSFEEPGSPQYPYDLTFKVNGDTVASGVAANSSTQITGNEYDITDEIVDAGSDGRGTHTILVQQGSAGGGEVRVQFMIRGVIVQGKVT